MENKKNKKKKKNQKKVNSKAFTLIELLAVITIMGILLLVAIPAVTRTIDNSRKDTFASVAKEYVNAVRNAVLAGNLTCYPTSNAEDKLNVQAVASSGNAYYFPICTEGGKACLSTTDADASINGKGSGAVKSSTEGLMESTSKSPYGSNDLRGYVGFFKKGERTYYSIALSDTKNHGFKTPLKEDQLKRPQIKEGDEAAIGVIGTDATKMLKDDGTETKLTTAVPCFFE